MYYLPTDNFKKTERKVVELILQLAPVEKLYLLGPKFFQQRTENIFMLTKPTSSHTGHCWLLVLVKNTNKSNAYWQDKIESSCQTVMPITAIVFNISTFINWLRNGHRFAMAVWKIAVLLYDSNDTQLDKVICEQKMVEEICSTQYVKTANEFIVGAEFYFQRQQNGMSAFMLHQATENALHGVLKESTGLHINTHNLDKLIRYCSMTTYRINDILPRNNEIDRRLFKLLQNAYIDARYKKNDSIMNDELVILLNRVKTLCQMVTFHLAPYRKIKHNSIIAEHLATTC